MAKEIAGRKAVIGVTSELVGLGLLEAINDLPQVNVCAVARTIEEMERIHDWGWVDFAIFDTGMIGYLQEKLSAWAEHPRVLLIAAEHHVPFDLRCAKGCACGFARLDAPLERLATMIDQVAKCPLRNARYRQCASCPVQKTLSPPRLPLSNREIEIFELISRHFGNTEIAQQLDVSVKTVESHRSNIKRKLGCASNTEVLEAALLWRRGLT